jgi:ribosomal protein S18 acetylase RimI-like enzyme
MAGGTDDTITIAPLGAGDIEAARGLLESYIRSLDRDLSFQHVDAELRDFPSKYSEPEGTFLLAKAGAKPCACAGIRKIDEETCEIKRLYVSDGFRGRGIGRGLVEAAIAAARAKGYRLMRLDTLEDMKAAQDLYRSLGFYEIAPYTVNPLAGTLFMEKRLIDAFDKPRA